MRSSEGKMRIAARLGKMRIAARLGKIADCREARQDWIAARG